MIPITTAAGHGDDRAIWRTLREHGALLIDGIPDAAAFADLTQRFATGFLIHHSPTRARITRDDTTQGVAPGQDAIGLHAERSYLPGRPELIFFHCLQAPASGGETTACDGAAIFDALPPALQRALEQATLMWDTTIPRASWTRAWATREDEPIGEVLQRLQQTHAAVAHYTIEPDGETLRVRYRCPVVERGWIGGRTSFANYLLLDEPDGPQARLDTGDPIPADWRAEAQAAADRLTLDLRWHAGQVAMLDNTRWLHGRRSLPDANRTVIVRMGDVRPEWRDGAAA